jgi:hypothetical protein
MDETKLKIILRKKKVPLTFWLAFEHYAVAIILTTPSFGAIYRILTNRPFDTFIVILGLICLIPGLTIYLYFGPRQLKLKKINMIFQNNVVAYEKAKYILGKLNWPILEETVLTLSKL